MLDGVWPTNAALSPCWVKAGKFQRVALVRDVQ